MKRAAKILVRQSDLAARLGLPAGTTVHRMELDTTELDPLLELTVTGEAYPPCYGTLQRMPLEEVAARVVFGAMPSAAASELERVKSLVYERAAQGLTTQLTADGKVVGEIPAPAARRPSWHCASCGATNQDIPGAISCWKCDAMRRHPHERSEPAGPTARVAWIGGTVVVKADGPIRAHHQVTTGPDGGVVEWDGVNGCAIGRARQGASKAGDSIQVDGFGCE